MRINPICQNYRNQNNYSNKQQKTVCFGSSPVTKIERHLSIVDEVLLNVLRNHLGEIKYNPPRPNLQIINIGCGTMGYGTEGMTRYFETCASDYKIYGIDPYADLGSAANRYGHLGDRIKFIQGYLQDALISEPHLKENVDVAIVRHPDIHVDTSSWFATFEDAYDNLREKGLMVFTTYNDAEMSTIKGFAQRRNYNIVAEHMTDSLEDEMDGCVMVLQKTNPI